MVELTPALSNARIEAVGGYSPSVALNVKSATLTYDRTWSPYIQGSLICAAQSEADATVTDPRTGLGVKFTLRQTFAGGAAQELPMVAWLRSRSTNVLADETTITFASIESLLQDYVSSAGQQYDQATNDLTVITDAIEFVRWSGNPIASPAVKTVDSSSTFAIAAGQGGWQIGSTLWDAINGTEEAGDLWVRGDESGVVLVRSAGNYVADGTVRVLTGTDRIVSVVDTVSRDNPDWANTVAVNYPNATTGAGTTDFGNVGSGVPRKTVVFTRNAKKPKGGAGQAIVNRMAARGRSLEITAIADLSLRPNQKARAQFRGRDWLGTVQRVTFRWPEGLMDFTLNVIES